VETIDSQQEEKILKEVKQGRSSLRLFMAFSGLVTIGSLGVLFLGPGAYAPYTYFGIGTSTVLLLSSTYRHSQFTAEIENWNSYISKHQDYRRRVPTMALRTIKAADIVRRYLAPEEAEPLWVTQVNETSRNLAIYRTAYIPEKARVIQELVEQRLLDRDIVSYFNHKKLTSENLIKFVDNQSMKYQQIVNDYERYKKSYETDKLIGEKLLRLEREKSEQQHDAVKSAVRTGRNLTEITEPRSTLSTLWANTITDVTTDVVEASKKSRDAELLKQHVIHDVESRNRYHENIAQLYPAYLDLFQEAVNLLK